MGCVAPAPLSSPGFSRFSQDSDCFFLSLNGITLLRGGGGGGSDFHLITLEMALCCFYTDCAPSAPVRPNPDSRRVWTREVDSDAGPSLHLHPSAFPLTRSDDFLQPDVLKHSSLVW